MTDSKITIDQLKNYLNTGLNCLLDYDEESYFDELVGIHKDGDLQFLNDQGDTHTVDSVKLECYKLSDLDKFIPELGFVPLLELAYIGCSSSEGLWGVKDSKATHESGAEFYLTHGSSMSFIFKNSSEWKDFGSVGCQWILFQKLFQWNFWTFDQKYFEQGLVIDKMTYGK